MSFAGKTTLLRDITRMLADTFQKVVIVVDPSQEIAGGGQVPHSCIGSARRMTGTIKQSKHEVLQEAVTNHGPEVHVSKGSEALGPLPILLACVPTASSMCLGCVCLCAFVFDVCKASNGTSQPTTGLTALELLHHALALCLPSHSLPIHF